MILANMAKILRFWNPATNANRKRRRDGGEDEEPCNEREKESGKGRNGHVQNARVQNGNAQNAKGELPNGEVRNAKCEMAKRRNQKVLVLTQRNLLYYI